MKIHHRIPCSLNKFSFKINIPESDELQIQIVGKLIISFYLFFCFYWKILFILLFFRYGFSIERVW